MAASSTGDVRAGLWAQLLHLDDRFWIVNTMEMMERLAYYGVRATVPIYMLLPVEQGGPGLDHIQKGSIFAAWAAVQSLLPMFSGGLADRYGHKNTIALAIAVKVVGYAGMALADGYAPFFAACLALAAGTALFKPGVQGTLAVSLRGGEASLGWGVFYQLVNVGGFVGPSLAGVLRLMDWTWVFATCAAAVSLNLLWLPFYTDATAERRAQAAADAGASFRPWGALAEVTPGRRGRRWGALLLGLTAAWCAATLSAWAQAPALAVGAAAVGLAAGGLGCALALGGRRQAIAAALAGVAAIAALIAGLAGVVPAATAALDAAGWRVGAAAVGFLSGSFVSWGAAALAVPLLRFAAAPQRYREGPLGAIDVVTLSIVGLFTPRVLWFCLIFSGFWLSFNQVFDLLPVSIDDWVDSGDLLTDLGGALAAPGAVPAAAVLGGAVWAAPLALSSALVVHPTRAPPRLPLTRLVLLALLGALAAAPLALSMPVGVTLALVLCAAVGAAALGWFARRAVVGFVGLCALVAAVGGAWSPLQAGSGALREVAAGGGQVNPEWLLNVNAFLIITCMVFVAQASARLPTLWSIIAGMCLATAGGVLAGTASTGWGCVAGLAVFSLGEMLSSPKKLEYLASLAPRGQEGLFMGYANIPVAIGWIAGSVLAGQRYEHTGDRANLARRYLVEQLHVAGAEALPRQDALPALAARLGLDLEAARDLLRQTYDPTALWWELAAWGLLSVVGMVVYDRVLRWSDRRRAAETRPDRQGPG